MIQDENDKHVFKAPVLRNIELTFPFFHDRSVMQLADAVRIMGGMKEIGSLNCEF